MSAAKLANWLSLLEILALVIGGSLICVYAMNTSLLFLIALTLEFSLDEYYFPGKSGAEWSVVLPFSNHHCSYSNSGIDSFVLGTNHPGLILLQKYRHVSTFFAAVSMRLLSNTACRAVTLLLLF